MKPPAREAALDALRGWMQLSIMFSHAFGSVTGAWFIHAAWGTSDSSEQFVFLSGFGLGSLFLWKRAQLGFGGAVRDLLPRIAKMWRTHMIVFLAFGIMVAGACRLFGEPGWDFAAAHPWYALLAGALTLYQPPPFMGILALFIYAMLALPVFSWLSDRFGAWALLLPAAMWLTGQFVPPDVPALGGTTIAFHPLSWIALFMLGAFFGRRVLTTGRAIGRHPLLLAGAASMILLGIVMSTTAWLPDALVGKEQLAPLRLLNALSWTYLAVSLVPRDAAWVRSWPAVALATIGRNSLPAFSLGLFCSYVTVLMFRHGPLPQLVAEPLMLGLSACAMWAIARQGWPAPSRTTPPAPILR